MLLRRAGLFTARRLGTVGGAVAAAFLVALLRAGFRRLVVGRLRAAAGGARRTVTRPVTRIIP